MSLVPLKQRVLLVFRYRNLVQSHIPVLNLINCNEPENSVLMKGTKVLNLAAVSSYL